MPKPPIPFDLKHSPDCGKVMGEHKAWFGPQGFYGQQEAVHDARPGDHWEQPAR